MPDELIAVPHTAFRLAETVHTILATQQACREPIYNVSAVVDGVMVETCIHCGQGRAAHEA